jgi:hypothetical protein
MAVFDSCPALSCLVLSCLVLSMSSIIVPRGSPISMRKSLLKWGVGSNKIEDETSFPSPPSSPRAISIDLPAECVDGFVVIQDDVVLSVDPSIAALLAHPSRLQDVVGKSTTHFALCCWRGDRSAMSAFSDMASGSRDRCRTPSVVSGKQLEWTAFKSKERVNRCVLLLATVREHRERAALSLEMTSSYETTSPSSANGSAIAAGCYLDQRVLDKEAILRLEAEHAVQRRRIDELEKEKEQTHQRNDRLEQEKRTFESEVVKERNLRLEAEQAVQSKWIDELEKEKEQARRNVLLEQEKRRLESDLLKERNQRLEAEKHADSHLNHTLKVCTHTRCFCRRRIPASATSLRLFFLLLLPESNCGGKVGTRTPPRY